MGKGALKKWIVPRRDDPINVWLCLVSPWLAALEWIVLMELWEDRWVSWSLGFFVFIEVVMPAVLLLVGVRAFWGSRTSGGRIAPLILILTNGALVGLWVVGWLTHVLLTEWG